MLQEPHDSTDTHRSLVSQSHENISRHHMRRHQIRPPKPPDRAELQLPTSRRTPDAEHQPETPAPRQKGSPAPKTSMSPPPATGIPHKQPEAQKRQGQMALLQRRHAPKPLPPPAHRSWLHPDNTFSRQKLHRPTFPLSQTLPLTPSSSAMTSYWRSLTGLQSISGGRNRQGRNCGNGCRQG